MLCESVVNLSLTARNRSEALAQVGGRGWLSPATMVGGRPRGKVVPISAALWKARVFDAQPIDVIPLAIGPLAERCDEPLTRWGAAALLVLDAPDLGEAARFLAEAPWFAEGWASLEGFSAPLPHKAHVHKLS